MASDYDNPWCEDCPNRPEQGIQEECAPCMAVIRLQQHIERAIVSISAEVDVQHSRIVLV